MQVRAWERLGQSDLDQDGAQILCREISLSEACSELSKWLDVRHQNGSDFGALPDQLTLKLTLVAGLLKRIGWLAEKQDTMRVRGQVGPRSTVPSCKVLNGPH